MAAELWALWDGINLCIALNLIDVIIELDAELVVNLIQKDSDRPSGNDVIIADCTYRRFAKDSKDQDTILLQRDKQVC